MKTNGFNKLSYKAITVIVFLLIVCSNYSFAENNEKNEDQKSNSYAHFEGKVIDSYSGEYLAFATLSITGTNKATICNSEGEFSIKVPDSLVNSDIQVAHIGYKTRKIKPEKLKPERNKIRLDIKTIPLSEVKVFPQDPYELIQTVLDKRSDNYLDVPLDMTAFYRESIQKGNKCVALSEAIISIQKQPYHTSKPDYVKLEKFRKSEDHSNHDTLSLKLMGGPNNALLLDIIKNPYIVLSDDIYKNYTFKLNGITCSDKCLVYVLSFNPIDDTDPSLYRGKLYIDSKSYAITDAEFRLNITDPTYVTSMFLKKRPKGVNVFPTEASYQVKYRQKDNKWIYSYSRAQVNFKIDWDKKLFNSNYLATIEMVATDWQKTEGKSIRYKESLKSNVVMQDNNSEFVDTDFWGDSNILVPEKPVEIAIKKSVKNFERYN